MDTAVGGVQAWLVGHCQSILLVKKLIQINLANSEGATPLFMACHHGRVSTMKRLLARKEIQINQAKNDGAAPLLVACQNNRLKVVIGILQVLGIVV